MSVLATAMAKRSAAATYFSTKSSPVVVPGELTDQSWH
jgi:hypothetical protein